MANEIRKRNTQSAAEKLIRCRDAVRFHDFGLSDYREILALQEALRTKREADEIPDTWLMGEHPTVITQGVRGGADEVLLASGSAIPIVEIDRGGMSTLHSPGQLILYPIVKLNGGALAGGRFARALLDFMEQWILDEFSIQTVRKKNRPGLFIGDKKLLSIGISVRRGVSMHGVALNMGNDLSLWSNLISCGDPESVPISLGDVSHVQAHPSQAHESLQMIICKFWGYEAGLKANPETDI